ncbi:hypothetical protein [Intestinibacillus sp. Marseille-P6563]|uniref:hypothetical protein n=1 Tax=Intestinibacillus sp. Marseille-P6563 TaxID=2364792 RepID=UPI0013E06D4E|nr:hypothetical protein [Intestinibacillus sp. Marseille-P6563]
MGQVTFEVPGPGQYIIAADPNLPQLENAGADADVLLGKQFYLANNSPVTGTMPNCGAVSAELNAGESFDIPYGYHDGEGKISSKSLESQTQGTATENSILSGETAWVNGQQITGNVTPGSLASDATATANTILSPYTAYVGSGKITGTIPTNNDESVTISGASISVPAGYYAQAVSKAIDTVSQAIPSITVNSSGLITASATQDAGYVEQGTESATQQLAVQGAQTITPSTSNQTIAAQQYLTGVQTIEGDTNLLPANIKSGISIFGVQGTYEGNTFAVPLVVTVDSGATVTAINGATELTAVSDGTATILLTSPGDWEVSAQLADGRSTNVVNISVPASYTATLEPVPTAQYYGRATSLTAGRTNSVSTLAGEYMIITGGLTSTANSGLGIETVAYDSSLTQNVASDLYGYSVANGAATYNSDYGIIGQSEYVTAYNTNLTRTQPESLNGGAFQSSAEPVGIYALFVSAQSNNYAGASTAYDDNLTKTTPASDSTLRVNNSSGHVGNYALFVGGYFGSTPLDNAISYDENLTQTSCMPLSEPLSYLTAATNGNNVIFVSEQIVNVYDSSLTRTILNELPKNIGTNGASSTCGFYSIFCSKDIAYAFNSSLTRSTPTSLQVPRDLLTSVSNGYYALFAGGRKSGSSSGNPNAYWSNIVEVYTGN